MSTSTPPDTLAAFRTKIANLPVAELRRRFPGEFNTHRRILADAKAGRCNVHDGFRAFRDFLGHVGPQGERSRTLDRTENADLEYGPGKVRWATPREQANNRSTTRMVRGPDGTVRSVSEWARLQRQKPDTIRNRLDMGWPEEDAVTGVRRSQTTSAGRQGIPSLDDDFARAEQVAALGWPEEMTKPKYEDAYQVWMGQSPERVRASRTRRCFAVWVLVRMIERNEIAVRASFPDYDPIEHDPAPPAALARLDPYQGLIQARRLFVPTAVNLTPLELREVEALKRRDDALMRPILVALGWVAPDRKPKGGRHAAN